MSPLSKNLFNFAFDDDELNFPIGGPVDMPNY